MLKTSSKNKGNLLRAAAYVTSGMLILAASILVWQAGALPVHRGTLSMAEFCQNYNQLQTFYQISRPVNIPDTPLYNTIGEPMTLNDQGKWVNKPGFSQSYTENFSSLPALQFSGSDEDITEISFSLAYENEDVTIGNYSDFMAICAAAYICAREDYHLLPVTPKEIHDTIKTRAEEFQDFTFTASGVTVTCSIQYSGFAPAENATVLVPEYGQDAWYHMTFTISSGK